MESICAWCFQTRDCVYVSELNSIIICGCLWDGKRLESGTLNSKSGFEGKSCESCHLLEQTESQGMREDI